MKLFYKDVSQIPQSLVTEYDKVEGGFALKLEDASEHPSLRESVAKVGEFRETNIGLNKQVTDLTVKLAGAEKKLATFGDVTPETITELKATIEGFGKKGLKKPEDLDEKTSSALKPIQDELATIKAALAASDELGRKKDEAIAKSNRETKLTQIAATVGIRPEAIPDYLGRAVSIFDLQMRAVDGETPILKDGKPLTPELWATDLRQAAPHLFKPSSGGGTAPNAGASGVKTISRAEAQSGKFIDDISSGKVVVDMSV